MRLPPTVVDASAVSTSADAAATAVVLSVAAAAIAAAVVEANHQTHTTPVHAECNLARVRPYFVPNPGACSVSLESPAAAAYSEEAVRKALMEMVHETNHQDFGQGQDSAVVVEVVLLQKG